MVSLLGPCPSCQFTSRFFCLGASPEDAQLFIYPAPPGGRREPVQADAEQFAGRVQSAYEQAVSAFNAQQWAAAAVMCGRALEAVVKTSAPEGKRQGTLGHLLKSFPENMNANGTIAALTDAIRRGRNIAAHFDEHLDVDEHLAGLLLDLLDSVVEYVYVLPTRIAALDESLRLSKAAKTTGTAKPSAKRSFYVPAKGQRGDTWDSARNARKAPRRAARTRGTAQPERCLAAS